MPDVSETQIASRVVDYMRRQGWEVYSEVLDPKGRQICDCYGLSEHRSSKTWAVEVKTSFSMRVIQQAAGWRKYSWQASVAVPATNSKTRNFAVDVCSRYGIGVIEIPEGQPLYEVLQPKIARPQQRPELVEEQKRSVAGQAGGGHWTPFRRTCSRLIEAAEDMPGMPLSDILDSVDHHYRHDRSALSSLKSHFYDGKEALEGSYLWWDGGTPYLWPDGQGPHPRLGEGAGGGVGGDE